MPIKDVDRNLEEFFDSLFSKIDSDDEFVINTTLNEFGQEIKTAVDSTLKRKGYDSLDELIEHKVSGKHHERPHVEARTYGLEGHDRYSYFTHLLENVQYDASFRGYYRDGHERIISLFKEKAKFCQEDLSKLEQDIVSERNKYLKSTKDLYTKGCLDGIEYVEKALKKSKLFMMTRIKEELAYRK